MPLSALTEQRNEDSNLMTLAGWLQASTVVWQRIPPCYVTQYQQVIRRDATFWRHGLQLGLIWKNPASPQDRLSSD